MRFNSRSFFFLIKLSILFFLITIIVLISLSYAKISLNRALNINLKEHIGYLIDSTLITKKYINRKIDLKPSNKTYIPKIYLNIENQSLDKSLKISKKNKNKKYFNATINYPDGKVRKIKYRIRGANMWHWDKEKPSIRIKN